MEYDGGGRVSIKYAVMQGYSPLSALGTRNESLGENINKV
jgi:hypothetical protein